MSRPPLPPFTVETAAQKARMAEDAWNSRDPERVSLADLSEWRYWLFQYRVKMCDPAKVASDTRKGLAFLQRLEWAHRARNAPDAD